MSALSRLRLLTLNTWGFRWPLGRDRDLRLSRLASHLRVSDYDVVALQELWGSSPARLAGSGLGWVGQDAEVARRHRRDAHGLGLKVRPGVGAERTHVESFAAGASFDLLKSKGFEIAHVDVGHTRVAVVNTHLQAGPRFARVRRHQLAQLLTAVAGLAAPVVLTGDFNLFGDSHEDRAAHAELAGAGFVDASETLDRPEPTWRSANPYVSPSDPDERFDRVYLRDGAGEGGPRLVARDIAVLVDHAAPLSDHEALAVTIAVAPREA